jgi:hypothetical protein
MYFTNGVSRTQEIDDLIDWGDYTFSDRMTPGVARASPTEP